jgi:hypothetical protein
MTLLATTLSTRSCLIPAAPAAKAASPSPTHSLPLPLTSSVKPSPIPFPAPAGTTMPTAKSATSALGKPKLSAATPFNWSGRTPPTRASNLVTSFADHTSCKAMWCRSVSRAPLRSSPTAGSSTADRDARAVCARTPTPPPNHSFHPGEIP